VAAHIVALDCATNALQHNEQMTQWQHTLLLMTGDVLSVQAFLTKVSVDHIMY
jgi:hypothetical protein